MPNEFVLFRIIICALCHSTQDTGLLVRIPSRFDFIRFQSHWYGSVRRIVLAVGCPRDLVLCVSHQTGHRMGLACFVLLVFSSVAVFSLASKWESAIAGLAACVNSLSMFLDSVGRSLCHNLYL